MELNADFTRRAAVHAASLPWQPSPTPGVDRRMLDRIGDEVARATSIVRYAPNSRFPAHTHGGGEEFLVLDGVFQDEDGDFPAGSYVRNPPGTRHTPGSATGCTIFVKLWQFDPATAPRCAWRRAASPIAPCPAVRACEAAHLFNDAVEQVRLERWVPDAVIDLRPTGGLELLVLDGSFIQDGATFVAQSWLRLPVGDAATVSVGRDGCRLWIKEGHLASR